MNRIAAAILTAGIAVAALSGVVASAAHPGGQKLPTVQQSQASDGPNTMFHGGPLCEVNANGPC